MRAVYIQSRPHFKMAAACNWLTVSGVNSFSKATSLGGFLVTSQQAHENSAVWVTGITSIRSLLGQRPQARCTEKPMLQWGFTMWRNSASLSVPSSQISEPLKASCSPTVTCPVAQGILWSFCGEDRQLVWGITVQPFWRQLFCCTPYFFFQFDCIYFREVHGWPEPQGVFSSCITVYVSCVFFHLGFVLEFQ